MSQFLLTKEVDAGITITAVGGLVPEYELREAAIFGNYNWTQWCDLTNEERVSCIAHYRIHLAIEAHVSDAYKRHANKQARTANKGKRR